MHSQFLVVILFLAFAVGCSGETEQPRPPGVPQPTAEASQPSPARPKPREPQPQEPTRNWRTVKRVIDGDTIALDSAFGEEKVRLIGVDTPETVDPRKPVERFGKEASEFTRKLVEGKRVWLEFEQTRTDKYLRTLAYVHLENGHVLNEEIIRYGYGHAYTEYPFKYMEKYRDLERQAREAEVGLWAKEAPEPAPAPPKRVEKTPTPAPVARPQPPPEPIPSITVYVTRTGRKYHRAGCRYLRKSCIPISLEDAKKRYGP